MEEVDTGMRVNVYPPPPADRNTICEEKQGGIEALSPDTSDSFPTSPANGFLWDPKVDGPFVADLQFEEDASPPIVRPFIIGSIVGCLGAAIYQVYVFKPVYATVSSPFLVLLVYAIGSAWGKLLPRAQLLKTLYFRMSLNPGDFGIQEHAVASMIAISAARGNLAVQTFAVQRLYYDSKVDFISALLGIFATSGFGCGVAGLMESMTTTASSNGVFPTILPVLSLLKELHLRPSASKGLRQFGFTFGAAFVYEILPGYISPLLTGVSVFCLSSQGAAHEVRRTFTNLFGGASGNEGLGLFSISFDWQFIGASFITQPLVYQANTWAGYILCYGAVMGIYYSNTWNSLSFPIISTSIFSTNGKVYEQSAILAEGLAIDPELLKIAGLPNLTSASLWTSVAANVALGSLITHASLFIGFKALWPFLPSPKALSERSQERTRTLTNNAPGWWYTILVLLSFLAGITVILRQHLHLSQVSFVIALVLGVAAIPPSTAIYGYLGVEFIFQNVTKMIASVILPGRPLAILYFSMWSNSAISTSIFFASQTKLGQHLKITSRVSFFAQLWGLILGGLVNYVMMLPIVANQGLILVNSLGLNIWSGQLPQTMNSEAVTWSLAKELYSTRGPYVIVPFCILIGCMATTIQYSLHKMFPTTRAFNGDVVMLPVVFMSSSMMTYGSTSSVLSTVILAIVCQGWLAKAHKRTFDASAIFLGSALDGGAQSMVLILSLSLLGALGKYKPFFKWAGNPVTGNVDYCNAN